SDSTENPFLGREMAGPRDHSEATAALLDTTVRTLLEERMATALRLLTENRDALDRLAKALLEFETLDRDGVEAAIKGRDVLPPAPPSFPSPNAPIGPDERPAPQPRPGVLPA
nr:cell division protein FtsH [Chloroflexaceae bacterium]